MSRVVALIGPVLFLITGLALPCPAYAQAAALSAASPPSPAVQLESLSRQRVRRWAATAPTIRCEPAPLTERPTSSAEFARPGLAPLEAAFFDAAAVKRTFAARVRSGANSN
jgi:hypothetical protein